MIHDARDSIRHGYATGWAHLHAVADRISMLAYDGRLSADDRDSIHDHLREVFGALDRLFDEVHDQPAIANDGDEAGNYRIYSDGTPVFSVVPPARQFPSPEAAVYCGDLGPADDTEPGAEVIVELPPHLRMAESR